MALDDAMSSPVQFCWPEEDSKFTQTHTKEKESFKIRFSFFGGEDVGRYDAILSSKSKVLGEGMLHKSATRHLFILENWGEDSEFSLTILMMIIILVVSLSLFRAAI